MATVENLCERSILLEDGRIVMDGPTRAVIDRYLEGLTEISETPLSERSDRGGDGAVRATAIQFLDAG